MHPTLISQDAYEMCAKGGDYSKPLFLIPIVPNGRNVPYVKEMIGDGTLIMQWNPVNRAANKL